MTNHNAISLDNISSKDIGYMIGLFIGDGYKIHADRHYQVEYYLNSERDTDIIYIKDIR
mgnify:CR=1 FL=1